MVIKVIIAIALLTVIVFVGITIYKMKKNETYMSKEGKRISKELKKALKTAYSEFIIVDEN